MIAKLRGVVDGLGEDYLVLDVHGVGYLVFCAARTLSHLPSVGEAVVLSIETHVREDHIHLYGFLSETERTLFRLLTTVQGVGAKVALAVLSVDTPERLVQALVAQDKMLFTRAPGVGPKLAGRLVSELRDKAVTLGAVSGAAFPVLSRAQGGACNPWSEDAVSALMNLGYGRAEAFKVVSQILQNAGDVSLQTLIGLALKELGREVGG